MIIFLEQIVNGLIIGATYALLGSGLALIYGTMRILNFAHGEFYMLGGFFVYFLISDYGLNPFMAAPIAIAGVFAFSAIVERVIISPLLKKEGWEFSTIATTLGISIVLQNLALAFWGEKFLSVPYYMEGMLTIGDFRLPYQRILVFVVAVLTIAFMGVVLKRTRFGKGVRATAQDAEAAAVVGVPASFINTMTFAIGSALAAVAAAVLAPIFAVNPWMGVPLILKGFVVVILGGLGSFPGAILAGFLLGVVEAVGVSITSSEWREVISFALLIIVIWVRPWGLLGVKDR